MSGSYFVGNFLIRQIWPLMQPDPGLTRFVENSRIPYLPEPKSGMSLLIFTFFEFLQHLCNYMFITLYSKTNSWFSFSFSQWFLSLESVLTWRNLLSACNTQQLFTFLNSFSICFSSVHPVRATSFVSLLTSDHHLKSVECPDCLIMAALRSRCGHCIFALWFLLLLFFPRLISAVADWMSTMLADMVWPYCEFKMQVWNVLHRARCK